MHSNLDRVSGSTNPETSGAQAGLADQLLHFLGSLGQPLEAELYLRLYRGLPGGRFALLAPTRGVLVEHSFSLAEQLGFLRELGLSPCLLVGAVNQVTADEVSDLRTALSECGCASSLRVVDPTAVLSHAEVTSSQNEIPIVWVKAPSDQVIGTMVDLLKPLKLVFLRRNGGLGPHGGQSVVLADGHILSTGVGGISLVNLRRDASELLPLLSDDDQRWLRRCNVVLGDRGPWTPRATISIASPLSLLRELFTERGEGTLVKAGSTIHRFSSYDDVDHVRLSQLLEEAFGRKAKGSFYQRAPFSIYVEKDFRGVALLEPGACGGSYLSKLAVLPVARGEGLGQDLWWELSKAHRAVYLRARPNNPITAWYATVCDGMQRARAWNVYWKGIDPKLLPCIIEDALAREEDFETGSAPDGDD